MRVEEGRREENQGEMNAAKQVCYTEYRHVIQRTTTSPFVNVLIFRRLGAASNASLCACLAFPRILIVNLQ